jgi:hypothetical protein
VKFRKLSGILRDDMQKFEGNYEVLQALLLNVSLKSETTRDVFRKPNTEGMKILHSGAARRNWELQFLVPDCNTSIPYIVLGYCTT